MPFIQQPQSKEFTPTESLADSIPEPTEQQGSEHSLWDYGKAFFSKGNTLGVFLTHDAPKTSNYIQDGFDPYEAIKDTPYVDKISPGQLVAINNEEMLEAKLRDVDYDDEQSRILREAGTFGNVTGYILAGVLDPINLITVGGSLRATALLMAGTKGKAALGALNAARSGAVSSALQSTAISGLSTDKDGTSVATDIIAGTLFSAVVGGAVGALSKGQQGLGKAYIEDIMTDKDTINMNSGPAPTSFNGMINKVVNGIKDDPTATGGPDNLGRISNKFAKNYAQFAGALKSPTIEGLTSPSRVSSHLTGVLFDHNNITNKNLQQVKNPRTVENLIWRDGATRHRAANFSRDKYLEMQGIDAKYFKNFRAGRASYKARGMASEDGSLNTHNMTIERFNEEAFKVQATGVRSGIKQINEVADYNKGLIDARYKKMQELGLVSDKEAIARESNESILNEYKTLQEEKLKEKEEAARLKITKAEYEDAPPALIEKIKKEVDEEVAKLRKANEAKIASKQKNQEINLKQEIERIRNAESEYYSRIYDTRAILKDKAGFERTVREIIKREYPKLKQEEVEDFVTSFVDSVIHVKEGSATLQDLTARLTTNSSNMTKARVLQGTYDEFAPYLVKDSNAITQRYLHKADTLIRLHEELKRNGFDSVQDVYAKLKDEYDRKLVNHPEDSEAIIKEYAEQVRNTGENIAIITGQYMKEGSQRAGKWFRTLRRFQYTLLMGRVAISSMGDALMAPFRNGFADTWKYGYAPMVRNFSRSAKSKDELKALNIGTEMEMNNILSALIDEDVGQIYHPSNLDKYGAIIVDGMSKLSGMSEWNYAMRRIVGQVSKSKIVANAEKFSKGTLTKEDELWLNTIGIDRNDLVEIKEMQDKYGTYEDGTYITNFEMWDTEIGETFGAAVLRDANSQVIMPSKGDIPKIAQKSEAGKTLFFLKSFGAAATNKITISGIQRRDARVLRGVVSLVIMGAFVNYIHESLSGREHETDPSKIITAALSRSGVLGLIADGVLALGKSVLPGSVGTKYGDDPLSNFLFGPSYTFVKNSGDAVQAVLKASTTDEEGDDVELSEADMKRIKKMIPFNNLLPLTLLMNAVFGDSKEKEEE